MTAKEFIDSLLVYLGRLRDRGQGVVPMEGVINNLVNLQRIIHGDSAASLTSSEKLAEIKASFDLEHYRAQIESSHRLFDSVMSTSDAATKSLFLINGGGCVAILALIGQLATKSGGMENAELLASPLLTFGSGLGMATFAIGLFATAQWAFLMKHTITGNIVAWLARTLALLSFCAFGFACWLSYENLLRMKDFAEPPVKMVDIV